MTTGESSTLANVHALPGTAAAHSKGPLRALRFIFSRQLHLAALTILVLLCFGRTLSSYFLADDFGEVAYVAKIFQGHPEILWQNFTGNYMQIQSMHVYRPWLLMTLVFDYMLWQGNAFGYYLSNLLYFTGDVLLLYLIMRQLTVSWSPHSSSLASLFAAVLFALNPLHCESISWVVGRVDSACCFYYLASLYFFLKAKERGLSWPIAAGTACYILGLLVKEMAIGLPLVVTCISFLGLTEHLTFADIVKRWQERLLIALRFSLPLWLSTIAYFVIRYLALGTLLGGYSGAIGATQTAAALERWLDFDSLKRFLFPFSYSLYGSHSLSSTLLNIAYTALLCLACIRFFIKEFSFKWLLFVCIWILTAAMPIYRLWGIGLDLEGARFTFFLTIPFAMLLSTLLFYPVSKQCPVPVERALAIIGIPVLLVMALLLGKAAYATNLLWVHAGKDVRKLTNSLSLLAKIFPAPTKIIILGIPKENAGAHMILNGETFLMMLKPPFHSLSFAERFVTFDPILFGPSHYINAFRFKKLFAQKDTAGPFVWFGPKKGLVLVPLSKDVVSASLPSPVKFSCGLSSLSWQPHVSPLTRYQFEGAAINLQNVQQGDSLKLANVSINPLAYDFLEFEIMTSSCSSPLTFSTSWQTSKYPESQSGNIASITIPANHLEQSGYKTGYKKIALRLSNHWRWYAFGNIQDLDLLLPNCRNIKIRNIQLRNATQFIPQLQVTSITPTNTGIYEYSQNASLDVDAQQVIGAKAIEIEITKPNYFFSCLKNEEEAQAIGTRLSFHQTRVNLPLYPYLGSAGYYEIRARALTNFNTARPPQSSQKTAALEDYSDSVVVLK